jgi:hypothetical protein
MNVTYGFENTIPIIVFRVLTRSDTLACFEESPLEVFLNFLTDLVLHFMSQLLIGWADLVEI